MSTKYNKLELTWIGKDEEPKLEPRILLENPEYSYGDPNTGNMLIHGDNLLALKALEQDFAGKVKCIYIDPPYNTGNAFEHYDDGIEHSLWLNLMSVRLNILRRLLNEQGVIFVQIDDEESAYLKVLMDEVFGRSNFVNTISVNMKNTAGASGGGEDKRLKKNVEYIHIYAKNYVKLEVFNGVFNLEPIGDLLKRYNEEGKSWKYTSVLFDPGQKRYVGSTVDGEGNEIKVYTRQNVVFKSVNQLARELKIPLNDVYSKFATRIFEAKDAQSSIRQRVIAARSEFELFDDLLSIEYIPRSGRNKGKVYEQFYRGNTCRLLAWLGDTGECIDGVFYKKSKLGTYWDVTSSMNNLTKEGGVNFPNGKKPEVLIGRIIEMATSQGDLVLDSFLGSGTTSAVALKMKRKFIGIEMGAHIISHVLPRLRKVISGEDSGGITNQVNWSAGGGFKFYTLAPSILNQDEFGNWVISKEYNAGMLAAALAKHEGFHYAPDEHVYWKQGKSSEHDFIFTTTQFVTPEQLDRIYDEMLPNESLLITCKAFQEGCENKCPNISIKKIPTTLLGKCEFGKEDYSFNIIHAPIEESEDDGIDEIEVPKRVSKKKKADDSQAALF